MIDEYVIGAIFMFVLSAFVIAGACAYIVRIPRHRSPNQSLTIEEYARAAEDPSHPMHSFVVYDMMEYLHETDPSEFSDFHHGG